jgi:RNA polymerase sigma factor FliA
VRQESAPRGDGEKTIEELVVENLALVGHLARDASARLPRHLDTDDLIGAGALALVQSAHAFEPSLGVPFARFASTRVRGAMIDQMRQRDWATRSLRTRAKALDSLAEELTATLHRVPTDTELAAGSGLSEAEVRHVHHGAQTASLLSLTPLIDTGEGNPGPLQDGSLIPEEALIAAERSGYLRDAIAELPERSRFVVSGYYLGHRPLHDLATELGITPSRASQLRSEGLDLLREALSHLLEERSQNTASPHPDLPPTAPGPRTRRREAYVEAVERRSNPRTRANVQAYLDGTGLVPAQRHPTGATGTPQQSPRPDDRNGEPVHGRTGLGPEPRRTPWV